MRVGIVDANSCLVELALVSGANRLLDGVFGTGSARDNAGLDSVVGVGTAEASLETTTSPSASSSKMGS